MKTLQAFLLCLVKILWLHPFVWRTKCDVTGVEIKAYNDNSMLDFRIIWSQLATAHMQTFCISYNTEPALTLTTMVYLVLWRKSRRHVWINNFALYFNSCLVSAIEELMYVMGREWTRWEMAVAFFTFNILFVFPMSMDQCCEDPRTLHANQNGQVKMFWTLSKTKCHFSVERNVYLPTSFPISISKAFPMLFLWLLPMLCKC